MIWSPLVEAERDRRVDIDYRPEPCKKYALTGACFILHVKFYPMHNPAHRDHYGA